MVSRRDCSLRDVAPDFRERNTNGAAQHYLCEPTLREPDANRGDTDSQQLRGFAYRHELIELRCH